MQLLAVTSVATVGAVKGLWAGSAHHHGPGAVHTPSSSVFQQELDAGMAVMMEGMHAPGYSGDPDADVLVLMVPHHQGAVDMARLVLQHGRDPVTRQLAEEIIAGQMVEIDRMQRRLALLRKDVRAAPGIPIAGRHPRTAVRIKAQPARAAQVMVFFDVCAAMP